MKVFLSWSGRMSRDIAAALDGWLPYVIQSVKPFVSTGDIDKGRRWSEVLAGELASIGYGIIVVTRDNLRTVANLTNDDLERDGERTPRSTLSIRRTTMLCGFFSRSAVSRSFRTVSSSSVNVTLAI